MQEIKVSKTTKRLLDDLNQRYREKKVFRKDGSLQEGPELKELKSQLIKSMGIDLKKHAKVQGRAIMSGEILYNMMMIVRSCSECICYVGAYDYDSGTCYYLGFYYPGQCA